ncbi:glycerol-3-phosphate 1-O-acyltransferase PlsY [Dolosigranulum pigrum]|uniref:glycerol-3-phosphate 1-O-acyltransferase PlsY n=1 Tax=Dolosigranulum pigrum TaxID=29394 RepID=UPI001AD86525|nr:glycerol-3-phosphate 1-O-acyltransferase PlsY [Dolosigranulum pigrum]QTJ38165.1 glycerol-3-phosphate 1-O-acyltransferase PlsY [Dolosigranulum pigrum]
MINLLAMIIAYLLGSIPSGIWIGKLFYGKDIRNYGSGNSGTTNTFRVLGVPAGIAVFIIDTAKGSIPVLLPLVLATTVHPLLFGLVAVLGHTFPIFAHFKGGKAVATTAGVGLGIYPVFVLIMAAVFATILFISSMVSLSSMLTVGIAILASLYIGDTIFTGTVVVLFLIIVIRHKSNIKRILDGTESTVPFGLRKDK